jgi:hypothetical protein
MLPFLSALVSKPGTCTRGFSSPVDHNDFYSDIVESN